MSHIFEQSPSKLKGKKEFSTRTLHRYCLWHSSGSVTHEMLVKAELHVTFKLSLERNCSLHIANDLVSDAWLWEHLWLERSKVLAQFQLTTCNLTKKISGYCGDATIFMCHSSATVAKGFKRMTVCQGEIEQIYVPVIHLPDKDH